VPRKADFDIFEERLPWETDDDSAEALVEPPSTESVWEETEAGIAPEPARPADSPEWELEPETWTAQPPARGPSTLHRGKLLPVGAAAVVLVAIGALTLSASHGARHARVHVAARSSRPSSGPRKAVVLAALPTSKKPHQEPHRVPRPVRRSLARPHRSVPHAASRATQTGAAAAPAGNGPAPIEATAPAPQPTAPVTAPVAVTASHPTARAAQQSAGSREFSFER
jgi:hypothetical protein